VCDLPGLVYATYGMAETCSHVALQKLNGPDRQQDFHALPGICLSQDDRGCLVIDASYLSIPVVTNDIITFTGPASFIWRGRFDNLINSGGIKLVPEEMEALIREKTGRECAVIGVTDPVLGQQAVVFLEGESDFPASQAEPAIKALFPGNAKPKEIIILPGLPRNDSMKIDRRMLQDLMRP
jgi:o-succinylbenzoate---CoA ligase